MKYACELRLLLSGEMLIISYNVIEPNTTADWLSTRMVRLSAEVVDLCLVDCVKNLLYSKQVVQPAEIDPKMLCKNIAQFGGFSSAKKLDEHSKSVLLIADENGNMALEVSHYEQNGGFVGNKETPTIYGSLSDDDFIEKIHQAFDLCIGSLKWEN